MSVLKYKIMTAAALAAEPPEPPVFEEGTLWSCGINSNGVTAQGTTSGNTLTLTQIGSDDDWVSFAVGLQHGFALKDDGTLYSWGGNSFGRTALGTASGDTLTPTQVGTDDDWASVALAAAFGFAIKDDGTLYSWGDNTLGRTGLGTDSGDTLTPTQIGSDDDWASVALAAGSGFAIKDDGTLYSWGGNSEGATAQGTTSGNTLTPTQVGTDTDWASVTLADAFGFAIKDDGTLWSWGSNENGRTGLGTDSGSTNTPTQVGTDDDWSEVTTTGQNFTIAGKNK